MKRRPEVIVAFVLVSAALAIFFTGRGCRPTANRTTTGAVVASDAAPSPAPQTPPITDTLTIPSPPTDEIPLIDGRDPAHAEALARIEHWFVRYLSEVDFVDRLSDQQLGELVRRLALARLSQSLYEAKIAAVERKSDGSVVISVPAYDRAGAKLSDYVARDLLREMTDARQRTRVQLQFYGYGHSPQTFTVNLIRDQKGWNDELLYSITHELHAVPPDIPMTLGSGLAIRQLGQYAPLARFFPQP